MGAEKKTNTRFSHTRLSMGRAGPELPFQELPQGLENKDSYNDSPETANSSRVQDRVHGTEFSPDLAEIIDRWESLPNEVRQSIIEQVRNVRADNQ